MLLELMEFLIELSVVAAGMMLVTVGISILILRADDLYKRRAFLIGVPVKVAIVVGATGPDDHTSLRQWAYYVLPTIILSVPFVMGYFRKRLQASKP